MTGTISLASPDMSVSEVDGVLIITFERTGDVSGEVTINYGITADNATSGQDFSGGSGSVVLAAGADRVSIQLTILDDDDSEPTEVLAVSITSVSSGTVGAPRTGRVSILDDENPALPPTSPALVSNYEVSLQPVLNNLDAPIKITFSPLDDDIGYVAHKSGLIRVFDVTTGQDKGVLLDLRGQVNEFQDRGLMDIALHPDLANNPYLYAFYVVDPADIAASGLAGPDGTGNRYAQVVRYTLDAATGYTTVVNGSATVLIGGAGQNRSDISGGGLIDSSVDLSIISSERDADSGDLVIGGIKQDYIKIDSHTHAGGALVFGPDGALYISIGDGSAYNSVDPRAVDVQNINSLSGKVLRVDPLTGNGLADNPFVTSGMDLDTNAAKVFMLGLRNPFGMGFDQDGKIFISETGWYTWEEINAGTRGANFGWPYFEGGDGGVLMQTPGYRDLSGAAAFYAGVQSGAIDITAAFRAFSHDAAAPGFQLACIVGGDLVYNGNRYPLGIQDDFFFTDFYSGAVFVVDTQNRVDAQFLFQMPSGFGPTQLTQGPDGYVWYVDLVGGQVGRLLISQPDAVRAVGTAVQIGDAYQLTSTAEQVGGVMSDYRIDITKNFRIAFELNFGAKDADGADGMAFVLHNDPRGATALGFAGSTFGLAGLLNGLGFGFDTYQNTDEIANDSGGFIDTDTATRITTPLDLGNIEDGAYHPVVVTWNAATSTLTITLDGNVIATLTDPNFAQTYLGGATLAHFGFTASTGGAFNDQRVRITDVDATEESSGAPTAVDDAFGASASAPLLINPGQVLGNDTDPEHDPLTVTAVGNAQNGTVALVAGSIVFTPTAGYTGAAGFDYTVADAFGGDDVGRVTITVGAATAYDFNGTAALAATSGEFVLTHGTDQAGGVNSLQRLDLRANFTLSLSVHFGAQDQGGGDGMAFVLHNAGAGALGFGGSAWGAGGIANGLAFAFDTWQNAGIDTLVNDSGGFYDTDTLTRGAVVDLGNIEDSAYHGLVVTWNAASKTLTVSLDNVVIGTLTDANFAATYFGGSNLVHFGMTGSTGGAYNNQAFRVVSVNGVYEGGNLAPVAVDDARATAFNTPLVMTAASLVANDTDANSDALIVQSVSGAVGGSVSLAGGNVTFTPTAGFSGPTSFDYVVSDGRGGTDTGTVAVTVGAAPNTPPVAVDDARSTAFNTPLVISAASLLTNDTDANSDTLTVLSVSPVAGGSVSLVGGNVTFTPTAGFSGPGSFDYVVSDGRGGTDTGTVTVTVGAAPNTPPVAVDDARATAFNTPLVVAASSLLTNDTDANGDTLTILSVSNAVGGSVSLVSGNVTFTPATGFSGAASFDYVVSDGRGGTDIGTVTVTVGAAPNTPPVAVDDTATATRNTPLVLAATSLLTNDTDANNHALTITGVTGAVNGTVSLANGQITFTPTTGFTGAARFDYTISDGNGGTDVGRVTIDVRAPTGTQAPIANADAFTTAEDSALASGSTRNLLTNDTDADSARSALTAQLVTGPANGTLTLNANGRFAYTPNANFSGVDTFTYRTSDGANWSAPATVTITVTPANDAPVLSYNGGRATSLAINENTTPMLAQIGATDPENTAITYRLIGEDAARFTLGADGALRFAAVPNFEAGTDTGKNNIYVVTVEAKDATGAISTQTFTIAVLDVGEGTVRNGATGNDPDMHGTAAGDILQGNAGNDKIYGENGGDTFRAIINDGNDNYVGGNGNDTLDYSAITQSITVTLQNRATGAQIGTDTLSLIENVIGGAGADTITGTSTANWISGWLGNDTLTGGGGVDTFVFARGFGVDTITDFGDSGTNQDMLYLTEFGLTSAADVLSRASQVGANVVIDFGAGDQLILANVTLSALGADDWFL